MSKRLEEINKQIIFQQRLKRLASEEHWTDEGSPVSLNEPIRLAEARRPLIIEVLQRDGRTVFDLNRQERVKLGVEVLATVTGLTAGVLVGREIPGAIGAIGNGISNGMTELGNAIAGIPNLSLGEVAKFTFYGTPKYLAEGLIKAAEIPLHCARGTPTATCGEIATVGNAVKCTISTGLTFLEESKVGLIRRGVKALLTKGSGEIK